MKLNQSKEWFMKMAELEEGDPTTGLPNPVEELSMCATMIRSWMPASFPANAAGQVHFVRAVMESVADTIERALAQPAALTEEQTRHMVNRFLGWRLPDGFNPDAGIAFKQPSHPGHWPSGTNLLDATQATAMVRHMLDGMPAA